MARLGRAEVFAPDEIATVHVMNRVVRRCFLLGTDSFSGKNYDHRKDWIVCDASQGHSPGPFSIGSILQILCINVRSRRMRRTELGKTLTWMNTTNRIAKLALMTKKLEFSIGPLVAR